MKAGPIDRFDLSAAEFWGRPQAERYEAYAALRHHPGLPLYPEQPIPGLPKGPGFYAVARHADIVRVSRDPKTWCSGRGAFTIQDLPPQLLEYLGSMIHMDDPRHARFRRIVNRAFTPRRLDDSLPWVRRLAADLVDDLAASSGPFDFVASVAAPFPLRIICRMMGVPWHRGDEILRLTTLMLGGMDPELQQGIDDPIQAYGGAAARMVELVEEIAEQRREKPEDDLISALVHGDVDGECLTASEIGSFFILLVAAGSETTRTAIAHGLVLLTEHPDEKERWRADLDGVSPLAVEEIVRFASPVTFMRRTATRETDLAGARLGEGDKVILLYGAANRDEKVFEDPERFDVSRSPNPHLGYGAPGPHYCLGANLARREITVMWQELLRRVPTIEVAGEVEYLRSNFVNGIKRLPARIA